jgi:hypothetical protein
LGGEIMSETKEALALNKTRVWNPVALKWICIFLSFYSGITLYIINFYRLKHHKRHKNTFIGISILLTVSVISFITPDHTLVSLLLLLTNVSVAAYFNYQQKELYSEHIENGGNKASAILGWIFGVLILLSLFLVYFVINFYITYI